MRSRVITSVCAALVCAAATSPTVHRAHAQTKPTPLILEEHEGERRVIRPWPGHPDPGETFTLKVDPKNGGSSQLVFITANLAPGGQLTPHKHPNADEILYLESGTARVHLGDTVREAHAGAMVFIPSGTVISLSNTGKENIKVIAVFSAPGFEDFMRDVSVLEGQPAPPMTEAEDAAATKKHVHDVIYQ
jgi:quercetin dioxygenase-like cupin family protein